MGPEWAETHMVSKELHDEGGDAAIDADENVDAGEDHIGGAGDGEEEGGWVHERRDGPAGDQRQQVLSGPDRPGTTSLNYKFT